MRKMPGDDSIFLSAEGPGSHLHTGAIIILDPTDCTDFGLDKLRNILSERIDRVPKLRWRIREVPLGLDRPYWEESTHCNIDEHLHRVCLPAPGSEKELAKMAGELLSRQLDRNLPLWELWYIEGLANNRIALLMKMHHALFDGISGMGLGQVLTDIEPNPPAEQHRPRQPDVDHGRVYSDAELYARGIYSICGAPYRVGKALNKLGWKSLERWRDKRKHQKLSIETEVPRVSFNGKVGASRDVCYTELPLATIKVIKNHYGVTVNDVVLAVCSSAIRRYLLAQGDLPDAPLVSVVPMSTRQMGDKSLGNKLGTMVVSLETHIQDPAERLSAIHNSANNAKELAKALGPTNVQELGSVLPPVALEFASWLIASAKVEDHMPLIANTVISNLPGPPIPLYMCGALAETMVPLGPIMGSMGFNITVMSYVDRVVFGFMLDPHLLPEPWYLSDGIQLGLEELEKTLLKKKPEVEPKGKPSKIRTSKPKVSTISKTNEKQTSPSMPASPAAENDTRADEVVNKKCE